MRESTRPSERGERATLEGVYLSGAEGLETEVRGKNIATKASCWAIAYDGAGSCRDDLPNSGCACRLLAASGRSRDGARA